jgi:hypothetical protein
MSSDLYSLRMAGGENCHEEVCLRKYILRGTVLRTFKKNLKKALSYLDIFLGDFISVLKNIYSVQKTIAKEWQSSSFYSKAARKSNFNIYLENLLWLIKNKEINYLYYGYSFDRKDDPVSQESYFPALEFKRVRSQTNKGTVYDYKVVLRDKLLFHNFLKGLNLRTPRIVSVGYRDKVVSLEHEKQISIGEFVDTHRNSIFFFKDRIGERGMGVYKVDIKEKEIYINNRISSLGELRSMLLEVQNYVIQEKIEQHKLLARYHSGSVNTIRIMTIKNRTGVHVLDAIMRFGKGGSSVDNLSAGGIAVSVDCSKGCLNEYGYKVSLRPTPIFKRVLKHDDSDILFKDFSIPFFSKAVDDIKKMHSFLDLHSIGWDAAITEEGPIYIEGNDNWDIVLVQAVTSGLRHRFYELING